MIFFNKCEPYSEMHRLPFVEKHIFRRVSKAIPPKFCKNCAFAQNFHIRKLDEITVFLRNVDYYKKQYRQ